MYRYDVRYVCEGERAVLFASITLRDGPGTMLHEVEESLWRAWNVHIYRNGVNSPTAQ